MREDNQQAHATEVRLITASNCEDLRDREVRVRDLRDLLKVAPGSDAEVKRNFLGDVEVFTSPELDRMCKLNDDQLEHDLFRLQHRLQTAQKRFL